VVFIIKSKSIFKHTKKTKITVINNLLSKQGDMSDRLI
jgi:hypothetical protein